MGGVLVAVRIGRLGDIAWLGWNRVGVEIWSSRLKAVVVETLRQLINGIRG